MKNGGENIGGSNPLPEQQVDQWQFRTADQDRGAAIIENEDKEFKRTRTESYLESEQGRNEQGLEAEFDKMTAMLDESVAAGIITAEQRDQILEFQMNKTIEKIDENRSDYESTKKKELFGQMAGVLQSSAENASGNEITEEGSQSTDTTEQLENQTPNKETTAKEGMDGETFQVGYGMSKEAEFKRLTGEDWPGVKYVAESYGADEGYDDPMETWIIRERSEKAATPSNTSDQPTTPTATSNEQQTSTPAAREKADFEELEEILGEQTQDFNPEEGTKGESNEKAEELAREEMAKLLEEENKKLFREEASKLFLEQARELDEKGQDADVEKMKQAQPLIDQEAERIKTLLQEQYGYTIETEPDESTRVLEEFRQRIKSDNIGGTGGEGILMETAPLTLVTASKYNNYWNRLDDTEKGRVISVLQELEVKGLPNGRGLRAWLRGQPGNVLSAV